MNRTSTTEILQFHFGNREMAEELKGPVYIPRDCIADGEACAGKTAQAEVVVHCEASFYLAS